MTDRTDTIHLHVGTIEEMGRRFVDAWDRAADGETVHESHITFLGLDTLLATLTPERLELVRYVRHHPVRDITALAHELHRDDTAVQGDLDALLRVGLLSRTEEGFTAPYDEIDARLTL